MRASWLWVLGLGCVATPTTKDEDTDTGVTTSTTDGTGGETDTDTDGDTDADADVDADTDTDTDTDTTTTDGSVQQHCVDTINDYRATLGLPPYARWSSGESCADGQCASDAASGTPHGAFGTCSEWAQNECPGWSGDLFDLTSDCLAMMWAEGPGADFQRHGHYINMSSTSYTEVACGYHQLPNGDVWAIQNFR